MKRAGGACAQRAAQLGIEPLARRVGDHDVGVQRRAPACAATEPGVDRGARAQRRRQRVDTHAQAGERARADLVERDALARGSSDEPDRARAGVELGDARGVRHELTDALTMRSYPSRLLWPNASGGKNTSAPAMRSRTARGPRTHLAALAEDGVAARGVRADEQAVQARAEQLAQPFAQRRDWLRASSAVDDEHDLRALRLAFDHDLHVPQAGRDAARPRRARCAARASPA